MVREKARCVTSRAMAADERLSSEGGLGHYQYADYRWRARRMATMSFERTNQFNISIKDHFANPQFCLLSVLSVVASLPSTY